jgi:alpha-1,2-glucosyltransferase
MLRVLTRAMADDLLDVVVFVLSLVIAALRKPLLVLKVASPYITLLVMFAGFVAWNGSVVLGKQTIFSISTKC